MTVLGRAPLLQTLNINARSIAYYLDQPQVINGVSRFVQTKGLYGAAGAKAAYDILTAKPGERLDAALQDGMVLAPVTLVTERALNGIVEHADPLAPVPEALKQQYPALKTLFDRTRKLRQGCSGGHHGHAHRHPHLSQVRGKYTFGEMKTIVSTILTKGGSNSQEHLAKLFPPPGEHGHGAALGKVIDDLLKFKAPSLKHLKALRYDKMMSFFWLGGAIITAGLVGGLLYDYVSGKSDQQAVANRLKEGIFQFVANIMLCVVGASTGIVAADRLKLRQKALLFPQRAMAYRGAHAGIVAAGLALGIFGGGALANWIGDNYINPFLERLGGDKGQLKHSFGQEIKDAIHADDREVEFMDAVLHLDDLPTALALAGVRILMPFVPLFFAVSGYRTGVGYRNSGSRMPGNLVPTGVGVPITPFNGRYAYPVSSPQQI